MHADPSLTAVVLTGIMGAITVTPLMDRVGTTDYRARGFAVGIAAHGTGTGHSRSTRSRACSPVSPEPQRAGDVAAGAAGGRIAGALIVLAISILSP
jgi:LrgB-like family protein